MKLINIYFTIVITTAANIPHIVVNDDLVTLDSFAKENVCYKIDQNLGEVKLSKDFLVQFWNNENCEGHVQFEANQSIIDFSENSWNSDIKSFKLTIPEIDDIEEIYIDSNHRIEFENTFFEELYNNIYTGPCWIKIHNFVPTDKDGWKKIC